MASSNSLEGKTALITGSGGGMGRSHAVLMSERGADIIVHDIKEDGAAETAEMVQKNGRKASVLIADVRDVPDFTAKIKAAEGEHGKIDILVNNAGVSGKHRMIDEIDEEIFDEMFGIQVRGAFFATKTVVEGMKQRKAGHLIPISSIYAMGWPRRNPSPAAVITAPPRPRFPALQKAGHANWRPIAYRSMRWRPVLF